MARPSKVVSKIRQKIEQKQLERQLKKSKRKAKRKQRKKKATSKVRKKTAPARIEAKATKQELGKLKQTVGDSSVANTLSGATKAAASGAKTSASALDSTLQQAEPDMAPISGGNDGPMVDGFGGPVDGPERDITFGGGGDPSSMDVLGPSGGDAGDDADYQQFF